MVALKLSRFHPIIPVCFFVILFFLIAWAFPAVAQQTGSDQPSTLAYNPAAEQSSQSTPESEPDRTLGGPEGVTQKLQKAEEQASTFPTPGWAQPCYDWKKRIKDQYGLSFGLSAYWLYQKASVSLSNEDDARPRGAIIYYMLGDDAKDVSLSVLDSKGNLIKTYEGDALGQESGLNRMIWDMYYQDVVSVPGKPPAGIVVEAKPGTYTTKLTVDGQSQEQRFELRMNPNETWTQADADARFELWWRIRDIFERANTTIIAAMELSREAEEDSKIAKQAAAFNGKLVPMGANLSQIANEPSKLLSKLQTVHWVLFQSEGRPPQSAYDVVDMLEKEIDAEIAAWNKIAAKAGKK